MEASTGSGVVNFRRRCQLPEVTFTAHGRHHRADLQRGGSMAFGFMAMASYAEVAADGIYELGVQFHGFMQCGLEVLRDCVVLVLSVEALCGLH